MLRSLIVCCLLVAACATSPNRGRSSSADLAFVHVNVVDVDSGAIRSEQTVLIEGGGIKSISPSKRTAVPAGARIVQARGKYLIPGLWDMHAHIAVAKEAEARASLPLYVGYGVTGIRNMVSMSARPEREAHTGVRPHIIGGGRQIEGPRQRKHPLTVNVRTREEASRAVDAAAEWGADFIKTREYLPRDLYFAVVNRAKARGLPFEGHVPVALSVQEASSTGQRSIEHFGGGVSSMLLFTSRNETALRSEMLPIVQSPDADNWVLYLAAQRANWLSRLLDSFDERKMRSLAAVLARNGTYVTPTFTVQHAFEQGSRHEFAPEDHRAWDRRRQVERKILQHFHRAGVPLLAGADVNIYMEPGPGEGLHHELQLLVEGGLTPLEALRTATSNAARYLKRVDTHGSVAQGKVADLVLLDANPLTDIRNTRTILAVVLRGRYFDRMALHRLITRAKAELPALQME